MAVAGHCDDRWCWTERQLMANRSSLAAERGAPMGSWRDRKRYLWLLSLILPTMLFVMLPVVWGLNRLGWHLGAQLPLWVGPVLIYLLLPTFDLLVGIDGRNPPDEAMQRLNDEKYYRCAVYAFVPLQYASTILGAYLFTAGDLGWLGFHGPLGWLGKIGVAFSVGTIGGAGINTAHELGHKKEELEQWLSKLTLAPVCYGHFYVEHNRGHHVRVATPEDPASVMFICLKMYFGLNSQKSPVYAYLPCITCEFLYCLDGKIVPRSDHFFYKL